MPRRRADTEGIETTAGRAESPAQVAKRLIEEAIAQAEGRISTRMLAAQAEIIRANTRVFPHALKEFANAIADVIKAEVIDSEDGLAHFIVYSAIELALRPTRYWKERPGFTPKWSEVEKPGGYQVSVGIFVEHGAAGRHYLWLDRGTEKHLIRPKNRKALLIRAYSPKTRPVLLTEEERAAYAATASEGAVGPLPWTGRRYQRRAAKLRSPWVTYYVSPKLLPRGHKGKYYSQETLRASDKSQYGILYLFAKKAMSGIRPRRFREQIAEGVGIALEREMGKLAKKLPAIFSKMVGQTVQCKVQIVQR